jgi:hypothetical protein
MEVAAKESELTTKGTELAAKKAELETLSLKADIEKNAVLGRVLEALALRLVAGQAEPTVPRTAQ